MSDSTADRILAFAEVRDIDEFIDGLRRYETGEMTADQFRMFRLARGTYGQRQPDVQMIRVKIPQGVLTAEQLDALAEVSETYSRGFGHVTTRQNIQYHFVQMSKAAEVMHKLAAVGLTTKEACGNTVRTITGCPMSGACGDEAFDVTPYAQAVTRHFLRRAENQALPRKFKMAFSGCADDCALGAINDVGCIARVKDGVNGFTVKVAGGLSTTPEDAHDLYEFLPADELIPVIEAVLTVFNKHGNRQNKSRARLKYVVRKLGWAGFLAKFEEELALVRRAVPIDLIDVDALARPPVRLPIARAEAAPGFERWRDGNVRAQKQTGFVAVTVRLVRGDITAAQFRGVADLARRFGDGMARLTIDQNLLLRFIGEAQVPAVHAGLAALGLATPDAGTIVDVTSCPGAESCNLAVTSSRELASDLSAKLDVTDPLVAQARELDIKISGCPNSCGQHHIAAIGFHGGMRRVGGKVVPEYTLHLGGGVDGSGATFGRQVVKLPARRVADALIRLLRLYDAQKQSGEKALAFFRRVSDLEVKAAVADLTKLEDGAADEDFLDLGDTKAFVVNTGEGECAV